MGGDGRPLLEGGGGGGATTWSKRRAGYGTALSNSGCSVLLRDVLIHGGGGIWRTPPPGMHWKGRHLRGGPRGGWTGGWRRLPKRLRAVTVGYKCHRGWHLTAGGQWLGIGWAPWRGARGAPPLPMHPRPSPPPAPHPKPKQLSSWENEIFNRAPKMRGPFQVHKLFFAPIPPPPPCPVGQTLSTTLC